MEVLAKAVDYGVIGILVIMSILAVATAVERWFYFRKVRPSDFKSFRELEIELTRGLQLIATVGFNAPYVGLLGTVLGIMLTFYRVGELGFADTREIMVGLALALKATAVGLLVAIPSVTLYRFLYRKARVILSKWEIENGR